MSRYNSLTEADIEKMQARILALEDLLTGIRLVVFADHFKGDALDYFSLSPYMWMKASGAISSCQHLSSEFVDKQYEYYLKNIQLYSHKFTFRSEIPESGDDLTTSDGD